MVNVFFTKFVYVITECSTKCNLSNSHSRSSLTSDENLRNFFLILSKIFQMDLKNVLQFFMLLIITSKQYTITDFERIYLSQYILNLLTLVFNINVLFSFYSRNMKHEDISKYTFGVKLLFFFLLAISKNCHLVSIPPTTRKCNNKYVTSSPKKYLQYYYLQNVWQHSQSTCGRRSKRRDYYRQAVLYFSHHQKVNHLLHN